MIDRFPCCLRACFAVTFLATAAFGQSKPPLSLDDLFSSVEIRSAQLAPDGAAAVFVTLRADWKHNRFREDLWLWRNGQPALLPLAQSGHDSDPQWSPDGKRIAFISDRPLAPSADPEDSKEEVARVWTINVVGGEAFPLYTEPLKVHSFAWTRDGVSILFSTADPLSKEAQEEKRRDWKDVERWRADERGDLLLEIAATAPNAKPLAIDHETPAEKPAKPEEPASIPAGAKVIARSDYAIGEIVPAPNGKDIAFLTNSISGRLEHPDAYEIYLVSLTSNAAPRQLTHNEALERQLHWSHDGNELYFGVFAASGSLEGKYKDVQGRLYALDINSGQTRRLGAEFTGSWSDYTVLPNGEVLGLGQLGTETQAYSLSENATKISKEAGTYNGLNSSEYGSSVLFEHSTVDDPTELFFATDAANLNSARQITHLNSPFLDRDLPRMKTYQWKTYDGKTVEGVLLYPPGKFGQQHLRMLTLIHGGPADADGNRFGADWYSWAIFAASKGWLVFQPNYRGSTGYGDAFMTAISPHIVSAPGRDILAGVDALVADGSADPQHLAIGGYSYGGYMTDWLITQTTRFRCAVTGAGAIEHASNWGNDDLTFDDAWYLGGLPWQDPQIYTSEAALFQMNKVKTPVHEVMGAADIRVSASQDYLLERALDALQIPHRLLIFPGEGHSLGKDPWHGYIKVREEIKWLEKYDQMPGVAESQ